MIFIKNSKEFLDKIPDNVELKHWKNKFNLMQPKKNERNVEVDNRTFNYYFGGNNLCFPTNFVFHFCRVMNYFLKKQK